MNTPYKADQDAANSLIVYDTDGCEVFQVYAEHDLGDCELSRIAEILIACNLYYRLVAILERCGCYASATMGMYDYNTASALKRDVDTLLEETKGEV